MKIAITGGTGFIGGHLARALAKQGHEVILLARGQDQRDLEIRELSGIQFRATDFENAENLARDIRGCDAIAHCAGINLERGKQTYARVHVEGTRQIVAAAQKTGISKIILISFLRARPNCGSAYHESKWKSEEIVRSSGLDYTIVKPGVIYGKGDHMLDHLSHAFFTFPMFGLVGFVDRFMRPLAIDDLVRILLAALLEGRLSKQTIAITGPEELALSKAVRRVAEVVGKKPFYVRLPYWFHYALGWVLERVMTIPLVSIAQVRILSEGIVQSVGTVDRLPNDLLPRIGFTEGSIRKGLPAPSSFGFSDFYCWKKCV